MSCSRKSLHHHQPHCRGEARIWVRPLSGLRVSGPWQPNVTLYEWAYVVQKLLATGEAKYRISRLYIEFENMADPEAEVDVPEPGRDASEAGDYFASLADSPTRDYLRVPVTGAVLSSTDDDLYPRGNRTVFTGRSVGTEGRHGKEFSASASSKVYGGALVAAPDAADPSQDLILARIYLSASQQKLKNDSSQIGIDWGFDVY